MRNWYKRPDKPDAAPLIDRRQLLLGSLTLLGMAVLLIVGLTPRSAAAPDAAPIAREASGQNPALLHRNCQVIQHLTYQPCGHSLTRRESLPAELAGKSRAELEAAYGLWQVTAYSAQEVEMEQQLSIHCPDHVVLMPDDSGMLCVFRNKYGDALAMICEMNIPLDELPEAVQDEIRAGKGFATQEEIDLWLEANDS